MLGTKLVIENYLQKTESNPMLYEDTKNDSRIGV